MNRPQRPEDIDKAVATSRGSGSGILALPEIPGLPASGRAFLDKLVKVQVVEKSAIGLFLRNSSEQISEFSTPEAIGNALHQAGILTDYQLDRVLSGSTHGMILGNYRVMERLGAGSMGVVFLGEHMLLKRRVAIKVLPVDDTLPPAILERFYGEMRVLADLHHPNIVMAFDAGKLAASQANSPALHYLVMELVDGGDIEQYVIDHNILPIPQACDMIRQAACGLQEAHDHHLIHRDIKPSNLLLNKDGQVKLVDFGLARQFHSNLTDPSCLLGSVEFMAPEQSIDPSAVDGKADIYGLAATLFWMLTGQTPYPEEKSIARALRRLQCEKPRRLRDLRPEIAPELDVLVDRMLSRDPAARPAQPIAVMNTLSRFAAPAAPPWEIYQFDEIDSGEMTMLDSPPAAPDNTWRVLVVDSDVQVRNAIRKSLEDQSCIVAEAVNGETALQLARTEPFGVILLQLELPDIHGYEVCSRLRVTPPRPHLKIVVTARLSERYDLAGAIGHGADDLVGKPVHQREMVAKVQYLLRLKDAQDRSDLMARHLLLANRQLEDSLKSRAVDVRQAHDALLYAMAKLGESRDGETAGHFRRMQLYCRALGETLMQDPLWAGMLNGAFLENLERCVPLHDIGKLALPDSVLSKPGPLSPTERTLMQTHPVLGATILDSLAQQYGESLGFLTAATVIVRHHHERYDGQGYPDALSGDAIPPAARLAAIVDVYDALRRKRPYKPAMAHEAAVRIIMDESDGQFDPNVLQAFSICHEKFKTIFQQARD
jgi:response regulator RpfG family c-di-GMP phosphodiesterase/serine/threonine protein kinase